MATEGQHLQYQSPKFASYFANDPVGIVEMDQVRPDIARRRWRRRILSGSLIVLALGALFILSQWVEVGVPTVEADRILIGAVHQGDLVREVRGVGTLKPRRAIQVPARNSGRVSRLTRLPGAEVEEGDEILLLASPELIQNGQAAELDLRRTEADLASLQLELQGTLIQLRSSMAELRASAEEAALDAQVNAELLGEGLVSQLAERRTQLRAKQLRERVALEEQRLEFQVSVNESRVRAKEAELSVVRSQHELLQRQLEALSVTTPIAGVLQEVFVSEGQQVSAGELLARVADPSELMAHLRISELQARDLAVGQSVAVDTRRGTVAGRIERLDPRVESGSVNIDVVFIEALPPGMRAEQTVEGLVNISRVENVAYMRRPPQARENSIGYVFTLNDQGNAATRREVQFGRGSISEIEVLSGLSVGESVILSDTSSLGQATNVRIK